MDIVMEDSDTEVMEDYWNEHSGEDCIGLETIRHYSFFDTNDVSGFFTGKEDQGQMSTGKGKHWKLRGSLDHYFQGHSHLPPSSSSSESSGPITGAALELCSTTLLNSTLAEECGPHLDKDLSQALDICSLDVSLTNSSDWATHSLLLLAAQCEVAVLSQRLSWPLTSQGRLKEPRGLREALNLSFTIVEEPSSVPVLFVAGQGSICDLRNSSCHQFIVKGQHLASFSRKFVCRLRPLTVTSPLEWQYIGRYQESEAKWKNSELYCNLPQEFLTKFAKSLISVVLEVEVGVIGGKKQWSNAVFLTVHNSSCSSCAPPSSPLLPTSCSPLPNLCHAGGLCSPLGGDHPSSPCQECAPSGWQDKANNGVIRSVVEYNLVVGQLLHYQLQDLRPLAQVSLIRAPTGATLKDDTLNWTPGEIEEVSFLLSIVEGQCGREENLEILSKVSACPCLNGGACFGVDGDCQCQLGFHGELCQLANPCFSSPCYPGVSCYPKEHSYICGPCPSDSQGDGHHCEEVMQEGGEETGLEVMRERVSEKKLTDKEDKQSLKEEISESSLCEPSPCYPGVSCTARDWYFTCGPCPPPSRGDGISCYTLPPVEEDTHQVESHRENVTAEKAKNADSNLEKDEIETTSCSYNDVSCYAKDDSSLLGCSSSPCHPGVACSQLSDGQVKCGPCPEGTVGDGHTCETDWCGQEDQPCFPGVSCHNSHGKAKCGDCPEGFEGNGVNCTPSVQPCSSSPCFYNVSCINVRMGASVGYVCGLCPEGMVGDGEDCRSSTDPCSNAPCYPGVTCYNQAVNGSFSCGPCPLGLIGDGQECHAIREEIRKDVKDNMESVKKEVEEEILCDPPCQQGVVCKEGRCGFCPAGTEGDGITCLDIDDCAPSPCHPSVPCKDTPAPERGYTCGPCPPPTIGDGVSCLQPRLTTCPADLQCYPGTTCISLPGGRVLCGDCPPGMEGDGHYCRPTCPPHCNAHQHCDEDSSKCEDDAVREAIAVVEHVDVDQVVQEPRVAPLYSPTIEWTGNTTKEKKTWRQESKEMIRFAEERNTSSALRLLSCRRTCRFQ